ncbi:MAG TPA: hypothetical protein VKA98_09055 [Nitrososphaeraceae archaeon]|nr:hypothetical protein [Nitrososphaeraceae archaeon]
METSSAAKEKGEGVQAKNNNSSSTSNALDFLVSMGKEKGFEVEQNQDYGVGIIDVTWNINIHPSLPVIKCGFIVLRSEEEGGGDKDWEDNQFSIRKIEEAAMCGIRSGMDKVYLLADNEEMAKSISGKIEWLASFGSLIRLDAISLGIAPNQQSFAVLTPSQQRVPEGEKIRKEDMREREAKFDEYNRPKGERSKEESKE